VAIKKLHHDFLQDRVIVKEFIREGELAMKIPPHPNIVASFGTCISAEGEPMIVNQLVPNGDLLSFVRENKLEQKYLVEIATGIAAGMVHLERHSVVHRDLSLRNVLLEIQQHEAQTVYIPKVSDFGFSRLIQDDHYRMSAGPKTLPVKWTPPEAMFRLTYTTQSDVWSFGILLVELFTHGDEPYPLLTGMEVHDLIKQGKRMARPPQVPEFIFETVAAPCWHEDPSLRPSFSVLFDTLNKFREESAIQTQRTDQPEIALRSDYEILIRRTKDVG